MYWCWISSRIINTIKNENVIQYLSPHNSSNHHIWQKRTAITIIRILVVWNSIVFQSRFIGKFVLWLAAMMDVAFPLLLASSFHWWVQFEVQGLFPSFRLCKCGDGSSSSFDWKIKIPENRNSFVILNIQYKYPLKSKLNQFNQHSWNSNFSKHFETDFCRKHRLKKVLLKKVQHFL